MSIMKVDYGDVGGGAEMKEGYYTITNSEKTIPLPFTPTRVYFENNDGTIGGAGYYDSENNINIVVNRISSGGSIVTNQISVSANQVVLPYFSANYVGQQ